MVEARGSSSASKPIDLDDVLINEIGQFGRFQLTHILLVAVPIIMSAFMSEYIFSAAAISYRCAIPEYESYESDWINSTIPSIPRSNKYESCSRYAPLQNNNSPPPPGTCPATFFDKSTTLDCDGNYVYGDNSIVYDTVIRLVLFLVGKFGIAVVFTSLYLFTSELYPTEYRHSLLGYSSMIGRIGSIVAPLTPVLAEYWRGLPSMLFGCMAVLSGFLILTQPETLGTKMPDTQEEAEMLGKTEMKR